MTSGHWVVAILGVLFTVFLFILVFLKLTPPAAAKPAGSSTSVDIPGIGSFDTSSF